MRSRLQNIGVFEGFLGENQEDIEQKSCFFGLIRGFFYRFFGILLAKKGGKLCSDAVKDTS